MSVAVAPLELVVLLDPRNDADSLAGVLDSLLLPGRGIVTVPPVRGVGYFDVTTPETRRGRVHLLCDSPGLRAREGCGAPGRLVVAVRPGSVPPPSTWDAVEALPGDETLALALRVVEMYATDDGAALFAASAPGIVRAAQATQRRDDPRTTTRGRRSLPPLLEEFDPGVTMVDPFEAAVTSGAARRAAVVPEPAGRPAASRADAWMSTLRRLRVHGSDDVELAARLVSRAPLIVVIGSRKGGVGKTSHAAGIAIAAGELADRVGRRVAILDANIANPDAWGHLALPPQAATVRQLVMALASGRPAPRPVNATTPALACYPETRDGAEYTRSDVRRIAAHLRERYALSVVDMSNRLPDVTAGPEAAVAAFWLDEADVLVLPTATSRNDFNAVLDYLDVGELPPVIVPCIVPSSRRTRNHPAARRYREEIGARVECVVDIPDEADDVRLAGLASVPVQEVSGVMRTAYRRLLAAVLAVRQRPR